MNHTDLNFYHIYPLGFCGCEENNPLTQATPARRIQELWTVIPRLKNLGINTLFLGPVFESKTHGYDTIDYRKLDERLGLNEDLINFVQACHKMEIRVIIDCVFNHVSRDCTQFMDVKTKKWESKYQDWFSGIDYSKNSPYGDGFDYRTWGGHHELVQLNLKNPDVKKELIEIAKYWIEVFQIDGLRMDAADVMDLDFLKEFTDEVKSYKPDLYILGEVIHGDYNRWLDYAGFDSVTNYEVYKGLYSSLNDQNYFEVAYSLKRQFGVGGIYQGKLLYNFVDNHDVNRVASTLNKGEHLYPLYLMLYTIPGNPSVYYFSELGMKGIKGNGTDAPLRPSTNALSEMAPPEQNSLYQVIKKIAGIRNTHKALQEGEYREVLVAHRQFAFERKTDDETILVIFNSDQKDISLQVQNAVGTYQDILNDQRFYQLPGEVRLYKNWGAILKKV